MIAFKVLVVFQWSRKCWLLGKPLVHNCVFSMRLIPYVWQKYSKGSISKGIIEWVGKSCWSTCNGDILGSIKNCSKRNSKLWNPGIGNHKDRVTATFTLTTDAGCLEPQYSSICICSIIFKHLISTFILNYALECNYQYCRNYIKPNRSSLAKKHGLITQSRKYICI